MSRKRLLERTAPALGGVLLLLAGAHVPTYASELEAPSAPFPPVAQKKKPQPEPVARAFDPAHVNARVKEVLRRKMTHHARDAQELFRAATVLDYDAAARAAHGLQQEPRLAKQTVGDEAAAVLGDGFFTLQDVLRSRAAEAHTAARAKDAVGLGQALGRITETCVSCHHLYLTPADSQRPEQEAPATAAPAPR